MKISIIIVGMNVKEWLIPCLKSIFNNRPNFPFEVIYVDNGSDDGSVGMVETMVTSGQWLVASEEKKKRPTTNHQPLITFRLIKNSSNLGFTKANNLGAKNAGGKYLLFLNSDTEILNGALGKMVGFLEEHPNVGVVGPKLYNSKKMDLQITSTGELTPLTAIFALSFINKYFPSNYFSRRYFLSGWNRNSIKEVDVVSGAALMIRSEIFKKIGGFDERYFIYFEETDLCMAVKKLGKKIVYYPEAGIIHYGGKTTIKISDKMKKIFLASRWSFFKKHYGFMPALVTESILRSMKLF